jgi:hypothetical protein
VRISRLFPGSHVSRHMRDSHSGGIAKLSLAVTSLMMMSRRELIYDTTFDVPALLQQLYRIWCRDTLPSGARLCSPLDPSTLPKSEPAHAGLGPSRQSARSPAQPAHTPSRSVCRSARCGPRLSRDLPSRSSRSCLRTPSVGAPRGDVPGSPESFAAAAKAPQARATPCVSPRVQRLRPQALRWRLFWPHLMSLTLAAPSVDAGAAFVSNDAPPGWCTSTLTHSYPDDQ